MQLGKYDLIEQLGQGGFGIVYKANDLTLDRMVALKVLHPQLTVEPRFIENFKREARLMAKVSHANVVGIYEVGEVDGRIYIAMQYLAGGNLEQKLAKSGPLSKEESIAIVTQVAQGLNAGHQQNLIHRDVKPANILFDEKGVALISDFGVAHSVQLSSTSSLSEFGGGVGTPTYRPPELWTGNTPPTPASDVYSLAAVLFQILTNEILFDGDTTEKVLTKHLLFKPEITGKVSPELEPILTKALEKEAEQRYQDMESFVNNLRNPPVLIENRVKSCDTGNNRSEIDPPKKTKKKLLYGVLFAGLFIMAALVTFYFNSRISRSTPYAETSTAISISDEDSTTEMIMPVPLEEVEKVPTAIQTIAATDAQPPTSTSTTMPSPTPTEAGPPVISSDNLGQLQTLGVLSENNLTGLLWGPDGNELFVTSAFKIFKYDGSTLELLNVLAEEPSPRLLAISSDGQLIAIENQYNNIVVRNTRTGKETRTLRKHTDKIFSADFNTNSTELISLGKDTRLIRWSMSDAKPIEMFNWLESGTKTMLISADTKTAIVGNNLGEVFYADTSTGLRMHTLEVVDKNWIVSLAFSPASEIVCAGSADGTVRIWDSVSGMLKYTLVGHEGQVEAIAISPKGDVLATGGRDSTIRLWNTTTGMLISTFNGNFGWVEQLSFSSNGKFLASLEADGSVHIWGIP